MSIYDDILAVRDTLRPRLVYAVSEALTPGKVIMAETTDWNDAYVIFHSEDEAREVARTAGAILVHLRDVPLKVPPIPKLIDYTPERPKDWRRW